MWDAKGNALFRMGIIGEGFYESNTDALHLPLKLVTGTNKTDVIVAVHFRRYTTTDNETTNSQLAGFCAE